MDVSLSPTVVSIFPVPSYYTTATGYVIDADPSATTYVLDCPEYYCDGSTTSDYARVTAAPSTQEFHASHDGTTIFQACTFTGTTEATCTESTIISISSDYEGYYDNVTYVLTPPATRGQENIFTYPKPCTVHLTSEVTRLTSASTATAAASGSSTAMTTTSTSTGSTVAPSGSAAGNATSDANPSTQGAKSKSGLIALAALAIIVYISEI